MPTLITPEDRIFVAGHRGCKGGRHPGQQQLPG
jgi:hypothetical protein